MSLRVLLLPSALAPFVTVASGPLVPPLPQLGVARASPSVPQGPISPRLWESILFLSLHMIILIRVTRACACPHKTHKPTHVRLGCLSAPCGSAYQRVELQASPAFHPLASIHPRLRASQLHTHLLLVSRFVLYDQTPNLGQSLTPMGRALGQAQVLHSASPRLHGPCARAPLPVAGAPIDVSNMYSLARS
jgi:hypothetical protein